MVKTFYVFSLFFLGTVFSSAHAQATLTPEQAINVSQQVLGGVVGNAVAVAGSNGKTYIATKRKPFVTGKEDIYLLTSFGDTYLELWSTQDERFGVGSFPETFALENIDGDGIPDLYVQSLGGGSGLTSVLFYVYNPANGQLYENALTLNNYRKDYEVTVATNLPATYATYLERKMTASSYFPDINPTVSTVDWNDKYGAFSTRQVNEIVLQEEPIRLPLDGLPIEEFDTLTAKVQVGQWTYKSFLKDGVYAVNEATSFYYLVYLPDDPYEWIDSMEDQDGQLVMITRDS